MTRYWIAVASADHVACGVAGGFMQVCHGKQAPLRRLSAGDKIVYYSPTEIFGSKTPLQAFTALGEISAGEPYQVSMAADFQPFRRDVCFDTTATAASIRPLIPHLSFIRDPKRWGYPFRFGLLEISAEDFGLIASAMHSSDETPT